MPQIKLLLTCITLACSSCALHKPSQATAKLRGGYNPLFKPIPEGYRPAIPYYLPEVTFLNCEYLSAAQLGDIRDQLSHPLCVGRYYQHIAAIVIEGSYETVTTTFTIWLLDGRRLDSGYIFLDSDGSGRRDFTEVTFVRQLYTRALQLLKSAIPESELLKSKNAKVA